jgi:hypothetical protein
VQSRHRPSALTFVAAPRQTVHVRHLTKYVDSCVPPGREFRFRGPDGRVRASADSLHAFRRVVETAPDDVLAHHAEHGDFSRWVRDVFADAELARQLRKIEARWRRGELADLRRTIDALITVRWADDSDVCPRSGRDIGQASHGAGTSVGCRRRRPPAPADAVQRARALLFETSPGAPIANPSC